MTPVQLRATDPTRPDWRFRAGVFVSRNWISVVALLALAVSSVAITMIVIRQKDLSDALARVQASRVETARTVCRFQDRQNRPILAILEFSYASARERRPGPVTEDAIRRTRELARPLTPEETRAACASLLRRIRSGPPPPP